MLSFETSLNLRICKQIFESRLLVASLLHVLLLFPQLPQVPFYFLLT